MKAVIMAGGQGERIRPITSTTPKPLIPLLGKPTVEYALDLLKNHGFKSAYMTLMYHSEQIISHFDGNSAIELNFAVEQTPLGTAGSVLNATSTDDDVLVISGDTLCDFNLTEIINYHKTKNADVTIVGKRVFDPREYGLITTDLNGKVTGFLEKPSYDGCVTDLANTGVYVLSKSALEMIPEGKSDFAQDLFPKIMKNNMNIYCYEETGFWQDIGDVKSYIACSEYILRKPAGFSIDGHRMLDGSVMKGNYEYTGARINAPVFIGENVKIQTGAVVNAGTVIGDNVTVSRGAKLHGCIVMNGAFIGEGAMR